MEKRTIEQPFKHLLCTVKVIISEYSNYIELVAYSIIGGAAIWAELDDIAISGYRPTPNMFFWVSIIAIISGLVAKMISFSDQKSLSIRFEEYKAAAEKEKQQLKRRYEDTLFDERRQALEECLQDLYENLAFKMQERICIYAYKDEDNHFTCRARYSTHPDHNKFSERKIYPGNDGVIGHVWHKGGHDGSLRDKDFPNPEINFQDYQKYLESTYNIPHHISEGLRMKSVDLYAEVIRDTKKRPVAVIVFESERNNFINEKKIETAYNSNIKVRIVDFLGKMQSHDFIGN